MPALKLKPVNPSVTPLPKVAVNIPKPPKIAKPKKPIASQALSPLFGQKRERPVIQSTPTRTPSF